jgi:hypothetical protein
VRALPFAEFVQRLYVGIDGRGFSPEGPEAHRVQRRPPSETAASVRCPLLSDYEGPFSPSEWPDPPSFFIMLSIMLLQLVIMRII